MATRMLWVHGWVRAMEDTEPAGRGAHESISFNSQKGVGSTRFDAPAFAVR